MIYEKRNNKRFNNKKSKLCHYDRNHEECCRDDDIIVVNPAYCWFQSLPKKKSLIRTTKTCYDGNDDRYIPSRLYSPIHRYNNGNYYQSCNAMKRCHDNDSFSDDDENKKYSREGCLAGDSVYSNEQQQDDDDDDYSLLVKEYNMYKMSIISGIPMNQMKIHNHMHKGNYTPYYELKALFSYRTDHMIMSSSSDNNRVYQNQKNAMMMMCPYSIDMLRYMKKQLDQKSGRVITSIRIK